MARTRPMHVADTLNRRTWCGVRLTGSNAVLPRHAQHVTCKRCLAALSRGR